MAQWQEMPTQWIEGRWLKTSRQATRGLLANCSWAITLEPQNGQCTVHHDIIVQPRNIVAVVLWAMFGRPYLDRRIHEASKTVALWAKGAIDHPMPRPRALASQTRTALSDRAMLADGSEYGRGQVSRLVRWMSQAQREDTALIRPKTLAALWNAKPDEVTEILFAASAAGILVKRWLLSCPNCGQLVSNTERLSEIREPARCQQCTAEVKVDLAHNVEVAFAPAEDLRGFQTARYAWDSPADHPAIQARVKIAAKSKWAIRLPAARAGLRARVIGTGSAATVASNGRTSRFSVINGTISAEQSKESKEAIELVNHDDVDQDIALGSSDLAKCGYAARRVLLLQAHRDIGSKELPSKDHAFVLSDVAIMATDLAGLAARYQRGGDADTFKAVSELLRETTDIVRDCGGSVASRLGEIVIAVFPDPKKAFAAVSLLSAHSKEIGLSAFRGSIDVGDLVASAHKGRLVMKGPDIEHAIAILHKLETGEIGLGSKLANASSLIKLIQGYTLSDIDDQGLNAQKFRIGERPKAGDPDQSASAA